MTPLEQADAAYTAAVVMAARTGDWGVVAAAHQAIHQARNTEQTRDER